MLSTTKQRLDAEAAGILAAVVAISHQAGFGRMDLERLVMLYAQAAYLFTYVEGNTKHLDTPASQAVKSSLLDDVELRGRLAIQVRRLISEASLWSKPWSSFVSWFLMPAKHIRAEAATRMAMSGLSDVLAQIDRSRAELLASLRLGDGRAAGVEAIATAIRQVVDPQTRSKLLLAWFRVGEMHGEALAAAMDRVVDQRWRHATALGCRSVAQRGFDACTVSADSVQTFLTEYADHALSERREFLSRFRGAGALDDLLRAASLLAERPGRSEIGVVNLGALLELVVDVAWRFLGIVMTAQPVASGATASFDVSLGSGHVGNLVLDRTVTRGSDAAHLPLDGPIVPEHPRARVLCFTSPDETVSFEGARQILHAMGHALAYVAAGPTVRSASGLDALPLERLEGLSHWFEELMNDSIFEKCLVRGVGQRNALGQFRRARDDAARNTRLEQAVVAAIDLNLHEHRGCNVRDVFDTQIAQMGGPFGVSFERTIRFMAAPLFRDHPGMGFVYPWGAAFGRTQARLFNNAKLPLGDLTAYFELDADVPAPNAGAEFECGRTNLDKSTKHGARRP